MFHRGALWYGITVSANAIFLYETNHSANWVCLYAVSSIYTVRDRNDVEIDIDNEYNRCRRKTWKLFIRRIRCWILAVCVWWNQDWRSYQTCGGIKSTKRNALQKVSYQSLSGRQPYWIRKDCSYRMNAWRPFSNRGLGRLLSRIKRLGSIDPQFWIGGYNGT